MASTEEFTKHF